MHNQNLSELSLKRLLILRNSDDGFEISEKDMFLRGSGDFFGTNQSGLPKWKFFMPYDDIDFLLSQRHKIISFEKKKKW